MGFARVALGMGLDLQTSRSISPIRSWHFQVWSFAFVSDHHAHALEQAVGLVEVGLHGGVAFAAGIRAIADMVLVELPGFDRVAPADRAGQPLLQHLQQHWVV